MPRWSILILTVRQRQDQFKRLTDELHRQISPYAGDVTVLVWDDQATPVREARQALLEGAEAEYVCFIDDDDSIADNYIDSIYPKLDGVVDYIGFRLQCYHNGTALKPTFHSLEYNRWFDDDKGYYRDISHLNPVRRRLALQSSYITNYPEDVNWADGLRGKLRTQHYVEDIMYHYYFSPEGSYGQMGGAPPSDIPRLPLASPWISYLNGVEDVESGEIVPHPL